MAKKKKKSADDIITHYMDYVLIHGEKPKSVYCYAKELEIEEQEFYTHFSSFEALEKQVFELFFTETLKTLHKSEDYESFDAKNKLLSFYFTFFGNLTANRSYVLMSLNTGNANLKSLKTLTSLRHHFINYITSLKIETFVIDQEKVKAFQQKAISESAWVQLLLTLKFWMDDTSADFEKTDIFIEKSVNTSFDLINTEALKSIVDFGKFLFKEKIHNK